LTSATHQRQLGEFRLLIAKDGSGGTRPLAELVDDLPSDLRDAQIFMEGGLMVIDTPKLRLLLDAGNGPNRGPRAHAAESAFAEHGVSPDAIDMVLLTHGDPDHIGGLLDSVGDLSYSRARYVLHEDLWNALTSAPTAGLYFPGQAEFVHRLATLIESRMILFDAPCAVTSGVQAVPAPGHRAGHTLYRFFSRGEALWHIGDAAFDPLFLERPELVIPAEYQPDVARATREALAQQASEEGAWIVGSHFRACDVGRLRPTGKTARFHWVADGAGTEP